MRKIFHFDSSPDNYHCDASVIGCFDNRFELVLAKFLKRQGVVRPDPVKIAGGAKSLASPDHDWERDFVLSQIEKSMRLHGTQRVILTLHSDCGAYGGLAARFRGKIEDEIATYKGEFHRAASLLKKRFPSIQIQCFYLNFDGVWEPDWIADPS